jgi:pyruvate/2-oxoglutarate/acetoin dehydrogenase E1 component
MGSVLTKIGTHQEEAKRAMTMLGQDDRTIFIGQQVCYSGSMMFNSLADVPMEKRIELPIMEETQLGIAIGMSLAGYIPICIYPRFDFVLLAMNQLVNHLEKIKELSQGEWKPKVIIRTMLGRKEPLYPGSQHCGDYTSGFLSLLYRVDVRKIYQPQHLLPQYRSALNQEGSFLIIEAMR